jgi:branched-chain amino acid transport system substrate-binding protein
MTTEAPEIGPFGEKFKSKYGRLPIQDAIKGYIAAWTTKYVTELVGNLDREAFVKKMHGLCLDAKTYPNVLLDICWDASGEVSRPSFMVQVKDGKTVVIGKVPAI